MLILCLAVSPPRLPTCLPVLALALGGIALASSCAGAEPKKTTAPASQASCTLEAFDTGVVRAVTDGRTFRLADGREVRLEGIEVPPAGGLASAPHPPSPKGFGEAGPPSPSGFGAAGPAPLPASAGRGSASAAPQATGDTAPDPSVAAVAALRELIDREVVLKHAKPATDRYGRLLADAFVTRDAAEGERSVRKMLLAQGLARVATHPGTAACLPEMRAAEEGARAQKLGLWGDPRYFTRAADDVAGIAAERGRFTVVEGKVVSVRESGGTIYVNFGRRWSEDFTVTIAKRKERLFSAAGLGPRQLSGRRVRIRGWIEQRGGPWIEASGPEQIEIVADK